jgi:TRAP-type C4-dicarboxylate transport system substrate-binding protein
MHRPACLNAVKLIPLALLVALAVFPCRGQASTVVKFATLAPEGSSWMQIFRAAAEEIQQKTAGAVKFKIYPGGVMGDERDMVRKLHIGQIHSAVLTSAGMSGIFPDMDVLQTPFLFDSYAEVDHVLGKMEPFFSRGLEENGYVLLGWSEAGFINLMATVPIETIDQLRKSKVWIWSDAPMAKAIFTEADVPGVPLLIPDVLVGLQTGLVEVVYAPPSGAIALQWFTRIKYLSDTPLLFLEGGVLMKKSAFDALAPPHQTVIRDVFRKHFAKLKDVIRKENQDALNLMRKQGIQFLTPAPEEVAEYRRISAQAMTREGSHKYSPEVLEEVSAHLKAFREGRK